MVSAIRHWYRAKFNAWLSKRIPPTKVKVLDNRSIFIFPTALGGAYLFVMVLVFLLGTNYQNNVIILLAYVLASVFITVMLQSYFNFKGLSIAAPSKVIGFAKQSLDVVFTLSSDKPKYGLTLGFEKQTDSLLTVLEHSQSVTVSYYAEHRGKFSLGRLKVSSEYSLGLFKTWTWCDFAIQAIVYPQKLPIKTKSIVHALSDNALESEHGLEYVDGLDDFHELNTYREGDSLTHVAWKHLARGQGKYTKSYRQPVSQDTWLNIKDMPSSDLEVKLSYMSYLVTQYTHQDITFGMSLLQHKIEPAQGKHHGTCCLEALAEFKQRGNQQHG